MVAIKMKISFIQISIIPIIYELWLHKNKNILSQDLLIVYIKEDKLQNVAVSLKCTLLSSTDHMHFNFKLLLNFKASPNVQ